MSLLIGVSHGGVERFFFFFLRTRVNDNARQQLNEISISHTRWQTRVEHGRCRGHVTGGRTSCLTGSVRSVDASNVTNKENNGEQEQEQREQRTTDDHQQRTIVLQRTRREQSGVFQGDIEKGLLVERSVITREIFIGEDRDIRQIEDELRGDRWTLTDGMTTVKAAMQSGERPRGTGEIPQDTFVGVGLISEK